MAWLAPGARLVRITGSSSTPVTDGGTTLSTSIRLGAMIKANEVAGGSVTLYWKSSSTFPPESTSDYVRFSVGSLALATGTPSVPSLSSTDVEFPVGDPSPAVYGPDDEIRVTSLGSVSIFSPVTVLYLTRSTHPTAGAATTVTVYGIELG